MEFSELDIFQIEEECRNFIKETVLCTEEDEEDLSAYVLLCEGVTLLSRSIRQIINGGSCKFTVVDGENNEDWDEEDPFSDNNEPLYD